MNLAIIGATGNVGRKTIEILVKSKLQFGELYLVASEKSFGKKRRPAGVRALSVPVPPGPPRCQI